MNKFLPFIIVAVCSMFGAAGQIFFKLASDSFAMDKLLTNWKLLVGLALYGFATLGFLFALRFGNLNMLYPIIALSYIWVAILSKIILHEPFPNYKWFGMALIFAGIIIIVRK